ncbi:MAG: serine hydrolase family protein [Rhodobiaceae bacterium]|nr:serine hydrolase family protein [Rhodobiaceae bacterium]MCC0042080.1 serine hydrolase family protein [Rhodobiaceae bacterium]
MKAREADLLVLPGLGGGTDNHWYRRWASRIATATVVEQDEWWKPEPEAWTARIVEHVERAGRPVVFIAHSLGTMALAHAAPHLPEGDIRGAFIVAPPDLETRLSMVSDARAFVPVPRDPLPFPSLLIASKTDPYASLEAAADLANAWGSLLVEAGDAGHINADSGHGPWPEGLMTFTAFLGRL